MATVGLRRQARFVFAPPPKVGKPVSWGGEPELVAACEFRHTLPLVTTAAAPFVVDRQRAEQGPLRPAYTTAVTHTISNFKKYQLQELSILYTV